MDVTYALAGSRPVAIKNVHRVGDGTKPDFLADDFHLKDLVCVLVGFHFGVCHDQGMIRGRAFYYDPIYKPTQEKSPEDDHSEISSHASAIKGERS